MQRDFLRADAHQVDALLHRVGGQRFRFVAAPGQAPQTLRRLIISAGARSQAEGGACGDQCGELFRFHIARFIDFSVGVARKDMGEQSIRRSSACDELHARDGARIETAGHVRCAFREHGDFGAISLLCSCEAQEFEESAAAEDDLTVERIGRGEAAVEIDIQREGVVAFELHQPGLAVVRVRRKERVGEEAAAKLGLLPRRAPSFARGAARLVERNETARAGSGEDNPSPDQFQQAAPGGHRSFSIGSISNYIV